MKVLVVGGGGREHALIRKIKESSKVDEIFCTPGNGGISYDAKCFDVSATDIDGVVDLAKKLSVDLVVVAPDDPLVAGMVDALNDAGFKTFGPRANAAIIEGSKVFSKELMQKYNIPTAEYKVFDNANDAIEYIKEKNEFPTVKIVRTIKKGEYSKGKLFGPFPSGFTVKRVYSYLRKLYPFWRTRCL